MTGFARRAAAGLLAAVFGISMLAGCTPNNAAVGDTQSAGDAVAHSMKDRNSLDVAMIGSQDEQTDRLALDAMEAGGLRPVYLPVAGTVDMQDTARQAVEDMAQRMVSIIVISGIDVSGVNHDGWYDTLTTARQAGIPVALLNPIATPTDSTLFAATLTINDRMTDATPLADAVAGMQGEVDVGQQQALAPAQGEITKGNHEGVRYNETECAPKQHSCDAILALTNT